MPATTEPLPRSSNFSRIWFKILAGFSASSLSFRFSSAIFNLSSAIIYLRIMSLSHSRFVIFFSSSSTLAAFSSISFKCLAALSFSSYSRLSVSSCANWAPLSIWPAWVCAYLRSRSNYLILCFCSLFSASNRSILSLRSLFSAFILLLS